MTTQLTLTVLEWYEMLPVKLRDKAQAYAMDLYGEPQYHADDITDSLQQSIMDGLWWRKTYEGSDEWANIHTNAPRYQSAYIKKHNLSRIVGDKK